jgi:hypothetical protein
MTRLGRPPKPERTIQWAVRLPRSIAQRWDLLLCEPTTGKISPNTRQELFIPLLSRLWDATLRGSPTIVVSDIVAILRKRFPEEWAPEEEQSYE